MITVYRPEAAVWNADFKTKKKDQKLRNATSAKQANLRPRQAPLVFDKEGQLVVIRDVPGKVCDTYGHLYIDADVATYLQRKTRKAQLILFVTFTTQSHNQK